MTENFKHLSTKHLGQRLQNGETAGWMLTPLRAVTTQGNMQQQDWEKFKVGHDSLLFENFRSSSEEPMITKIIPC